MKDEEKDKKDPRSTPPGGNLGLFYALTCFSGSFFLFTPQALSNYLIPQDYPTYAIFIFVILPNFVWVCSHLKFSESRLYTLLIYLNLTLIVFFIGNLGIQFLSFAFGIVQALLTWLADGFKNFFDTIRDEDFLDAIREKIYIIGLIYQASFYLLTHTSNTGQINYVADLDPDARLVIDRINDLRDGLYDILDRIAYIITRNEEAASAWASTVSLCITYTELVGSFVLIVVPILAYGFGWDFPGLVFLLMVCCVVFYFGG